MNISVRCFLGDAKDEYILNSSMNPDLYFISKQSGIINQIFKPCGYFYGKGAKKPL
jgi:hypothetical protein